MSLFLKYVVKDLDTDMFYDKWFDTYTEAYTFRIKEEDRTGHLMKVFREDQI